MRKLFIIILISFISQTFVWANTPDDRPYVLIISFDGFRWDYPDRGITPNIDKMITEGVRAISFQPAFPSKTFPNHYSIVTGLYPQNHGLVSNRFANRFSGDVYKISDSSAVKNDMWYQGESVWATAKREGVKSASFFWPGSETYLEYRHPTYYKAYDHYLPHEKRIQGIIDWLQLPEEQRPHLLFLYFSDTDTQGHRFGPESREINEAVQLLDSRLGQLREKLKQINMLDKVNIILLSDHGMTNVFDDRVIKLYEFLDISKYKISGHGPMVQFFTQDDKEKSELIQLIKKHENGFKAYTKETMPAYYHYSAHSYIGDIILVAELGYSFVQTQEKYDRYSDYLRKGDHGYDNQALDMHGIFIASGPAFKSGYKTGTLINVDVYPLVCKILGITANQMIDGKLERIAPVLK